MNDTAHITPTRMLASKNKHSVTICPCSQTQIATTSIGFVQHTATLLAVAPEGTCAPMKEEDLWVVPIQNAEAVAATSNQMAEASKENSCVVLEMVVVKEKHKMTVKNYL